MEVGKAAINQRADEVEGQGCVFEAAEHALRVRRTLGGGEAGTVDDLTAVTGQGHAVAFLGVRAARFGVLTGKAADPDDPAFEPEGQHKAHLQEDLELVGDDVGGSLVKAFGTRTPLEKEPFSFGGLCEL